MPTSVINRKRSRSEFLDQDDQSPELRPASTRADSAKKRKLDATSSSSSTLITKSKGVLGTVGSFLGLLSAAKKSNRGEVEAAATERDGLARESDVWDISLSDGEDNERGNLPPAKRTGNSWTKKTNLRSRSKKGGSDGEGIGGPRESKSDDAAAENSSIVESGTAGAATSRSGLLKNSRSTIITNEEAVPPKRPMGRTQRKSDILRRAKTVSRRAKRSELTLATDETGIDVLEQADARNSGADGADVNGKIGMEDHGFEIPYSLTPTRRKRGRPRKNPNAVPSASTKAPKGILTPSRKDDTKRNKKNVAFEMNERDLGFKDIPKSTTKRSLDAADSPLYGVDPKRGIELNAQASSDIQDTGSEEGEEEDDDDVTCAVCGLLDSEEPNLMLLCDKCDLAVHQECYAIPVVPDGDWFCRECQPYDNIALDNGSGLSHSHPNIPGFDSHLSSLQNVLMLKLTGRKKIKLVGHDDEMQKVHQIVAQTVLTGEGNSMIIVGARGSGKTTLVEGVISDLYDKHREDFHTVRLNGFIHTDDKLALKETWRQLGREMEIEDDQLARSSYADTLATLLAVLSHPSEISESTTDQTPKSIVFILDEFDLFTGHPRQTLLYNLFDIAQAKKAPILVLGLTARIDVVDALEKRVKSRFSHRLLHLSLPRSLPTFWEVCKAGLTVKEDELRIGENGPKEGHSAFTLFWNSMVEDLYNNNLAFKHHLESHFHRTKSVPGFFASSILPIASLSPKNVHLLSHKFTLSSMSLSPPDSKLHILQGLSGLELALLIAAARLDIILDTDTCNFAMVYDEYSSLTSKHRIQTSSAGVSALGSSAKVWGRDVALGAWERLADYELIMGAGIGGVAAREYGAAGRMWKVDVGLEEIAGSVDGMSALMAKWCREI